PTPHLHDSHFKIAQVDRHFTLEGDGGPGQAWWYGFHRPEEAGETPDFAGLVLLTALHHQVVGVAAGNDFLGVVSRGAEHTHRRVVGKQYVFDGFVGDFTDATDHVLRRDWGGLGVHHHDRLITDDHAGIRVTFGRIGIGIVRQLLECDFFIFQVALGSELLAHRFVSSTGGNENTLSFVYVQFVC